MIRESRGFRRAAAGVALVLLCAGASFVRIRSYDFWWHLETGEQIVATGSVPRADDFSFTSAGAPWIDHEWLFQVLVYSLHPLGPVGLTLMKGLFALAAAAVGYATMRRSGAPPGAALAVVSAACAGMRFRLAERPETITLALAVAVAALALDLASNPTRPVRRLALMAALTILWVNVHAGALLAPALALACAGGTTIERLRAGAPGHGAFREPVWLCAPITAVCLLVNPFGHRVYLVPIEIAEALAPGTVSNPEWAAPSLAGFPFLYLALTAVGLLAIMRVRQRRPLAWARLGLLAIAGGLSIGSVRHIGLFFALLPLMIDAAPASRWRRLWALTGAAVWIGAVLWMFTVPPPGGSLGTGLQEGRFPERAADFIDQNLRDARLYNDVSFGGYLIWRGYPARRVFIDGRNEVHAALLGDIAASIDDGRRWRDLLALHGVEGAVVAYRPEIVRAVDAASGRGYASTFSELHFPRPEWALVYWDDVAMVFVLRQGRFARLAASDEYREARPEAWTLGLFESPPAVATSRLAEEIVRRLAEEPGCKVALAAAAAYRIEPHRPAQ